MRIYDHGEHIAADGLVHIIVNTGGTFWYTRCHAHEAYERYQRGKVRRVNLPATCLRCLVAPRYG